MIGQVNSVLSNFCCFLLKNVIFWFKKYCFWLFWATWIFWFKNIFSVSFQTNFFWFFKLSSISLGQLSSILSNFLWFFVSKNTFLAIFWILLGRNQKNVFYKPFAQIYYGHFKLSTISLGKLSTFLSNFLWFFASKNTVLAIFEFSRLKSKKHF